MSDDGLEVYVYRGNDGEEVPRSVQHLIVKDDVRIICSEYQRLRKVTFPDGLTAICDRAVYCCYNLLEINNIPNSVHVIGEWAFRYCTNLKKIEFEDRHGTSPHQLRTIYQRAFEGCESLERVKLTSSVLQNVGRHAFCACYALMEANLSATCLTEIHDWVFASCTSLLTVGLPNTTKRIGKGTFSMCNKLVTVVVPFDSQSITIEESSFVQCTSLANIVLPQGSTVEDDEDGDEPFEVCSVLHSRFGHDPTSIVAGLVSRFDANPIHRLCYDHSRITVQELRRCIPDHQEANSFVDEFRMTPLHVFFSTPEPSVELLDVLLESLPYQLIHQKDANDKRSLDYLVANWTDANSSLFQITVQKWVLDRLARWGAMSWIETMQSFVQEILSEQRNEQRSALSDQLLSAFELYSNTEATSMLELALWKVKLRSGWSNGAKRQAMDREECRCVSGSNVVIPNVNSFLKIPQESEGDGPVGILINPNESESFEGNGPEGRFESESFEDDGSEGRSESESSAESSLL